MRCTNRPPPEKKSKSADEDSSVPGQSAASAPAPHSLNTIRRADDAVLSDGVAGAGVVAVAGTAVLGGAARKAESARGVPRRLSLRLHLLRRHAVVDRQADPFGRRDDSMADDAGLDAVGTLSRAVSRVLSAGGGVRVALAHGSVHPGGAGHMDVVRSGALTRRARVSVGTSGLHILGSSVAVADSRMVGCVRLVLPDRSGECAGGGHAGVARPACARGVRGGSLCAGGVPLYIRGQEGRAGGCHRRRYRARGDRATQHLSLIHISEPTRLLSISYAVFCL